MLEKYSMLFFLSVAGIFACIEVLRLRKQNSPPANGGHRVSECSNVSTAVVFRDTWLDVQPSQLKVIVIAEGNAHGQLVVHGPFNGVLRRLLILDKKDKDRSGNACLKMKTFKLAPMIGVQSHAVEEAYESSLADAMKIANVVLGKKKKAEPKAPAVVQAISQPIAVASPVPVPEPVQEPVKPVSAQESEAPRVSAAHEVLHKYGFEAQYVGKILSAGMQQHTRHDHGVQKTFQSYTVEVETPEGPMTVYGVDLQRAMMNSEVKEGDRARIIHVKTERLPNRIKKHFQVIKL